MEGDILVEAHDVELNNNASFYRAILAIHKENYAQAQQLIQVRPLSTHLAPISSNPYLASI